MAFGGSAELGRVWVFFATDIICRLTLTRCIFTRLAVYLEYGIRFPLTGGELHYVSRVLYPSMMLLLSQIWKCDIGVDSMWKHDFRKILLSIMLIHDH